MARTVTDFSPVRSNNALERPGLAKRKSLGLIELGVARAYGDGGIPEVPHHLHSAGVVPDVRRYASARAW